MKTHKFEMTITKLPVTEERTVFAFFQRKCQNQIYSSIITFMRDKFGIDKKEFGRQLEQNDKTCTFAQLGTLEECNTAKQRVENLSGSVVKDFTMKFKDIRLLPKSIRDKIVSMKISDEDSAFVFLQTYLGYFNITLTVDVNELPNEAQYVE